jgi:XTP/dITP diphosphohydrolase
MRILLATNNPGKAREVREILAVPGLEIVTPRDLGEDFVIHESGDGFEANARLKAEAAFKRFGIVALADDSGLEIDALSGKPGVHSSRFMGERSSHAEKHSEILRLMRRVAEEKRTARFRCCAVLIRGPAFAAQAFEGVCEGRIARQARGKGGFGYDPVFVPDGYKLTFAELPAEVKNRISHRAKAFARVRDCLGTVV